jgi:hypothetical protein
VHPRRLEESLFVIVCRNRVAVAIQDSNLSRRLRKRHHIFTQAGDPRSDGGTIVIRLLWNIRIVSAGPPSGIYRVQVGRFKDHGEAERTRDKLKKEEQFNPWITR